MTISTANLQAIRTGLAAQVQLHTGLQSFGDAKDMQNPPCMVVLPGRTFISYGQTMDGAADIALALIILMANGAPTDVTQQQLDSYLGMGTGTSIPDAIEADPRIGGIVDWCVPQNVTNYQRITWNGVPYFGARLNVSIGV